MQSQFCQQIPVWQTVVTIWGGVCPEIPNPASFSAVPGKAYMSITLNILLSLLVFSSVSSSKPVHKFKNNSANNLPGWKKKTLQGLVWQSRKYWHWCPVQRKFQGRKKNRSQWILERSLWRFKRSVQSKTTLTPLFHFNKFYTYLSATNQHCFLCSKHLLSLLFHSYFHKVNPCKQDITLTIRIFIVKSGAYSKLGTFPSLRGKLSGGQSKYSSLHLGSFS